MSHSFSPMIFPDYESLSRHVASEIFVRITEQLDKNEKFVLGMATGNSPIGIYKYLVELFKEYKGDLSKLYTVNLDEYYPMKRDDPNSYYSYMMELFWGPLSKIHPTFNHYLQGLIPDGSSDDPENESQRYETMIKEHGGIDLQILGIGTNGHIGFNEPGTARDSRTSVVELAQETIEVNKAHFGGDPDKVPRKAFSMGIGTILEAKEIFLVASGASKAPILEAMKQLSSPTEDIPASFLLEHPKTTFFIDIAAQNASK